MPIPGLRDQQALSFPKIGDIRKGSKKQENGQMGKDLTYFRYAPIEGEELAEAAFHEVYGDEPREINAFLPFDEINRNLEAYMELHTAGALQCRGDIEGDKCFMWRDKASGEMQHIPKDCPMPICKGCKETGRLKIIIPELRRLAYVTVHTTSKWDVIELTRNLGALRKLTGNGLKGIPLVLKRRPRIVSTPRPGGKRVRQEKWLLSIEADQRWVEAQLCAMEIAALPNTHIAELSPPEVEEIDEETFVDEITGEIMDAEPAEEPEPEPETEKRPSTNGQWSRPMNPINTRYSLRFRSEWVKGQDPYFADAHRQPDDKQEPPDSRLVQRVAALMGKALTRPEGGDTDLERHLVLSWVFGVERTGLLTALEAQATAKWLEAEAGSWIPSGVASEECRLVLHQAMKDRGQMELEMEHPDAE